MIYVSARSDTYYGTWCWIFGLFDQISKLCVTFKDQWTMGKQNHLNLNNAGFQGMCWEDGAQALVVLAWPEPSCTRPWPKQAFHHELHFSPCSSSRFLWSSGKCGFFFLSQAFLLLKILNHSSPNSYFCLLVFPTRLSHWKPSVNDCLVSCSEEREGLMEGADEGREEEQERPRPGNCTLCNLHCSQLKGNKCKKLFSSCATDCFNLMRSDQFQHRKKCKPS